MNFRDYLTEEERLGCWRLGFVKKIASCGIKPSDLDISDPFEKDATWVGEAAKETAASGKDLVRAGASAALLLGLPLGAMLHFIHRSIKKDSKETEKLEKMRDLYSDVVQSIKDQEP
jgi:hypothetical protein